MRDEWNSTIHTYDNENTKWLSFNPESPVLLLKYFFFKKKETISFLLKWQVEQENLLHNFIDQLMILFFTRIVSDVKIYTFNKINSTQRKDRRKHPIQANLAVQCTYIRDTSIAFA